MFLLLFEVRDGLEGNRHEVEVEGELHQVAVDAVGVCEVGEVGLADCV